MWCTLVCWPATDNYFHFHFIFFILDVFQWIHSIYNLACKMLENKLKMHMHLFFLKSHKSSTFSHLRSWDRNCLVFLLNKPLYWWIDYQHFWQLIICHSTLLNFELTYLRIVSAQHKRFVILATLNKHCWFKKRDWKKMNVYICKQTFCSCGIMTEYQIISETFWCSIILNPSRVFK